MPFFKKIFTAFTALERKTLIIIVTIGIVALIVAASTFILQATKPVPAAGGDFTEGMVGQPEYVNPVTAQNAVDQALVKLVYADLNDVADSIQASADGKTWTVRLKPNLRFQDGQKLTSDDIIFTVQSIQNPDAGSPLASAWRGVTASRASELELSFTLGTPYAFFSDTLANLYILPKHLFADVPPGNWRFSDYNLKPVGSGAYAFTSYDRKSDGFVTGYHLAAWKGFSGAPALIQNFNLVFFQNQGDLTKAFNAAQIDGFAAEPGGLLTVKRPSQTFAWPTTAYYAVFFNQANNAALADPAVRLALSQAVDRDGLVKTALQSYGSPDYGPVPPAARYAASLSATSSLDAASSTLDAAGWHLNGDGVRQTTIHKATTTLAFTLTVPDNGFLVATAQALQQAWQQIGAQVTIATDTPANVASNQATNRAYEALLYGNVLGPSSDLYAFWDSVERFAPGENLALYNNSADDKLIANIRTSLNDASRTTMFASLQQDIVSANPAIFLYSPNALYVSGKTLHGVNTASPLSDPSDRFRQVSQWYLNTTRVLK